MDPNDTKRRAQKKKKGAGTSRSALKAQRGTILIVIVTFTPAIVAIITIIIIVKRSKFGQSKYRLVATPDKCISYVCELVTAYSSIAIRSIITRSYSEISLSHSFYSKLEKYNQPNPSTNSTWPLPYAF